MKVLLGLLVVLLLLFVIAVACAFLGAVAGWITGCFFPTTLTAIAHLLGLTQPYQLGAACGFVGGFFKGTCSNKDD